MKEDKDKKINTVEEDKLEKVRNKTDDDLS